ncbi:uncharacterized protein C8A04DRAFT_29761 [Dichotomopilus funicola]|uniref:RING-type domain-containing protein n=1 Tax=Dichotomopilus funicola TaxID=1934379 RepID=A0AAN6V0S4_9PEZI|nr:hypothetical protein C8A04DRAFT_29761 [Dichotomopilus funicola]
MAAVDPMDYVMHQPDPAPSAGPGFHGMLQHQGCPYVRSQHQHQPYHGSSLPHPQLDAGINPMHHQLPHFSQLPHPDRSTFYSSGNGPGNTHGGSHGPQHPHHQGQQQPQQQQQQQQQQQHNQPQQSHQPPPPPPTSSSSLPQQPQPLQPQHLPPIQPPPTLPFPQSYPQHTPHYDAHAASSAWFQTQNPGTSWPIPSFHPNHGPGQQPSGPRLPGVDSHFGGPGSGPGAVQPLGGPNQPYIPHSHHHTYSPYSFPGFPRPTSYARTSAVLPIPPQISNPTIRHDHSGESQANQATTTNNTPNQTNQPSTPGQAAQTNQSSRSPTSQSPSSTMSADRDAPSAGRQGFTLPSLNPNTNQGLSSGSHPNPQLPSSSSQEVTPPSAVPSDPTSTRFPQISQRPGSSHTTPGISQPGSADWLAFHLGDFRRADGTSGSIYRSQAMASDPAALSSAHRRHQSASARRPPQPDQDSDEDLGSSADEAEQMLRLIDGSGINLAHIRATFAEDHLRASQVLRGQITNKRVASKIAVQQLQSVDPDSLPETERTCVICYNDFGQASPEGIIEAPLRLPKCQHVFGDHCIKKWFEESDSCPYCRDKVPSELAMVPNSRYNNLLRMRTRLPTNSHPGPDEVLRLFTPQDSQYSRHRARLEGGSEGSVVPRPSQRRSPPTEAENRRRTRVRHSSGHYVHPGGMFTGGPARSTGAPSSTVPSGQHSPTSERVTPPNHSLWPVPPAEDSDWMLTSRYTRQFAPSQRLFYQSAESGRPPATAASPFDSALSTANPGPSSFRLSTNAPPPLPPNPNHQHQHGYFPNTPFGTQAPSSVSQQLPPISAPSFQNALAGRANAPHVAGPEAQVQ